MASATFGPPPSLRLPMSASSSSFWDSSENWLIPCNFRTLGARPASCGCLDRCVSLPFWWQRPWPPQTHHNTHPVPPTTKDGGYFLLILQPPGHTPSRQSSSPQKRRASGWDATCNKRHASVKQQVRLNGRSGWFIVNKALVHLLFYLSSQQPCSSLKKQNKILPPLNRWREIRIWE